jgi:hypothetical protein
MCIRHHLFLFLLLAGIAAFRPLHGQDFDSYQPLRASGKAPQPFITASSKKYQEALKVLETEKADKQTLDDKRRFMLDVNFRLDDLLHSGLILYNDPVSIYLQELVDTLSGLKPALPDVHIYAFRSTEPNAFADARGTIFVSMGLLAALETEAQLAFVLCHELAHIQEGHAMSLYLESQEIKRSASQRRVLDAMLEEFLVNRSKYSRDQETEADDLGMTRFLQSPFGNADVEGVFDILKLSYLPYLNKPFERRFLEREGYTFPESYWKAEVNAIGSVVSKEDSAEEKYASHPDTDLRKELMIKRRDGKNALQGQDFVLPAAQFFTCRNLARFELPFLYLKNHLFPDAIYSAYLLAEDFPDNEYLESVILKSLYMQAKLENSENFGYDSRVDEIEGESQQVHSLLESMDTHETTILALRYAWEFKTRFPANPEADRIVQDLFLEFYTHFESLEAYRKTQPQVAAPRKTSGGTRFLAPGDEADAEASRDSVVAKGDTLPPYWKSVIPVAWETDPKFSEAAEKARAEYDDREKRYDYFTSSEGRRKYQTSRKKEQKKGLHMGIDRIVIVNPRFLEMDERKDFQADFISSEYSQMELRTQIRELSVKAGLDAVVLDVEDISSSETEVFNDIRYLNEWFAHQNFTSELTLTPGYQQAIIDSIADKYQTDYFLMMGVLTVKQVTLSDFMAAYMTLFFPPVLPYTARNLLADHTMVYYALLFDVKTGRRQVVKYESVEARKTRLWVDARLYDTFLQIKK